MRVPVRPQVFHQVQVGVGWPWADVYVNKLVRVHNYSRSKQLTPEWHRPGFPSCFCFTFPQVPTASAVFLRYTRSCPLASHPPAEIDGVIVRLSLFSLSRSTVTPPLPFHAWYPHSSSMARSEMSLKNQLRTRTVPCPRPYFSNYQGNTGLLGAIKWGVIPVALTAKCRSGNCSRTISRRPIRLSPPHHPHPFIPRSFFLYILLSPRGPQVHGPT